MAMQTITLDPAAQAYADLSELDSVAATKLAGIAEGAEVNPADLAALDATAATKLGGIEDGAQADQDGAEIRDLVVALTDTERKIVITNPLTGEFKLVAVQVDADTKLRADYDDTPEP